MVEIIAGFARTLLETLRDVLPIALALFGFQFWILRRPIPHLGRTVLGFVYVLLGLALFLEGLEAALFPLGRLMATQLTDPAFLYGGAVAPEVPHWADYLWVYVFGAAIGFATTIAEPALIAVALKAVRCPAAPSASGACGSRWRSARRSASASAPCASSPARRCLAHPRRVSGRAAADLVRPASDHLPLAFDSGGVTTSTVTVPLVTALGLGLAGTIPGRSPLSWTASA